MAILPESVYGGVTFYGETTTTMGGHMTGRRRAAALLVFTLAMATTVVTSTSQAGAAPNVVRLHLGTDFQAFTYGTTVQTLRTGRNTCAIAGPAGTAMALSSNGNQPAPGLANNSIGIKASPSSSNGTPCGQVDAAEVLRLRPGSALGGRTFSAVRLDLEMTGNAVVVLTLSNSSASRTFRLQTGTSITEPIADLEPPYFVTSDANTPVAACAAPNSSGPNSFQNDNCLWHVDPDIDFDTVTLTTSIGSVSLEGSADFGNDPAFDSLFFLSNSAPMAVNDTLSLPEDSSATVNVLANDIDGDGDPLTTSIVTPPVHGVVEATATVGVYRYTPAADYNGPDSFVYSVTDGNASSTATVQITVTPVNDAPVALSPQVTTAEDTPVTIPVATDIDSAVINADCGVVTGGTVTDLGDGSIVFTPDPDANGLVTFSCTITDAQGATSVATASVQVGVTPVNDAPVAADDSAEVDENGSVVIDVVANDDDVDGDTLTVSGASGATKGSLSVSGGTVTYTPDVDTIGADSFTYTVTDGNGGSDTATVLVTIFQVICSGERVTTSDGDVEGIFDRLSDDQSCKRYVLESDGSAGEVLFTPEGAVDVQYRGFLSFGPEPAPSGTGELTVLLEYDPTGGTSFRPVRWCIDPVFDGTGAVTSATLPAGETWCVASETTSGAPGGQVETIWQVYGEDDPRFR